MKNTILFFQFVLLIMSYTSSNASEHIIRELSRDIQNKKPDEVRRIIITHLGPASQDIGSGVRIELWNVNGGQLSFHPFSGVTYFKNGKFSRLINTTNPVGINILGNYEMMSLPDQNKYGNSYWLGNVILRGNQYRFKDTGQSSSHRGDQTDNYFLNTPTGTFRIRYLNNIKQETLLENIESGIAIAKITFNSIDSTASDAFHVITDNNAMRLSFSGTTKLSYKLRKSWENHWQ